MVPTHQLAENAALGAIQNCAGLSVLPAAAESQLWISPVSFVNILDLFQHELNTNPVIQLGQLLPPGHTLKQTCYVRTCCHLHVSRKSRGIRERIFPPPALHPEFFISSTTAIKICMTTVNDNLFSSSLDIQQVDCKLILGHSTRSGIPSGFACMLLQQLHDPLLIFPLLSFFLAVLTSEFFLHNFCARIIFVPYAKRLLNPL